LGGRKKVMSKTKTIIQPEKDNPLWRQLLFKLTKMFKGRLDIVFPIEWNEQYFSWFHIMEKEGFRWELRYSFEEIAKILENPDLVFWFVTLDGEPQILLLGYSIPHRAMKSFYLDTLAVRCRGKGIGHIVMDFLILWARTKQYQAIILDTELRAEKGIPLQHFYAKHGFKIVSKSKTGDIKMECVL